MSQLSPTESPERRQRLTAQVRRLQVADTALQLIASDGAAGLTAAKLSAAVGVSDAALFRHYASMADIVHAAVALFGGLLAQSLRDLPAEPQARLCAFFCHRLQLVSSRPEVLQLAFNDRLADAADAAGAHAVRQHVANTRNFLFECIEQGQRTGAMRRDVSAQALAWTVMGTMRGAAHALSGLPSAQAQAAAQKVWSELWILLRAKENDNATVA